jgi:hypothetical protein
MIEMTNSKSSTDDEDVPVAFSPTTEHPVELALHHRSQVSHNKRVRFWSIKLPQRREKRLDELFGSLYKTPNHDQRQKDKYDFESKNRCVKKWEHIEKVKGLPAIRIF